MLDELLEKYAEHGIGQLDDLGVLEVPPLSAFGSPVEIAERFGGAERAPTGGREARGAALRRVILVRNLEFGRSSDTLKLSISIKDQCHVQTVHDLRRRLIALAATQAGYFTAAQAQTLGYSYPAQAYHVERGNWLRVDRGLFRLRRVAVPALDDDLVRWSLWVASRAVVSHETALSVHELGEFDPARVHLTVPPGFRQTRPRRRPSSCRLADPTTSKSTTGFRVTTPLRSLVDVAAGRADLDQLARGDRRGPRTRH